MLRTLTLWVARSLPTPIKTWVHQHRGLDQLSRKVFGSAVRAGGRTAVIESGPMKGIQLALGEHVSHAHIRGTYELETLEAVDRLVQPGSICYDLGASIGYLSLLMARKAKQVFSFEPAPHARLEMERQVAANSLSNITIVPLAVSDSEKTVEFAMTDAAYGSRISSESGAKWQTLKLKTTTLDIFVKEHPFPDFLKIDVEDEEGRVLAGARSILQQRRAVICCEIHSRESAQAVMSILAEYGYLVTTLAGGPFVVPDDVIPGVVQVIAAPAVVR